MEGIGKTSETKGPNSRRQSQLASAWDCMSIYSNDFKCVYIAPIVARYISSSTYAYQLLSVVSRAFHAYTVPVSTSTWNVLKLHTSCFYFVMDRIPTQFRIDGSEHRMCSRRDGFIGNIQKHYVSMVLGGFIRHVRVHSLFLNDFPSCSFFHEQIHEKSIFRADQIHGKLQLRRRPKPSAWPGSGASCGRRRSSAPAPQRWWLSARSSASEMSAGVS
jgi:hypothetical protein